MSSNQPLQKLSGNHLQFVYAYLRCWNGMKAVQEVYPDMPDAQANKKGSLFLSDPLIKAMIKKERDKMLRTYHMSTQRLHLEQGFIALSDMRRIFDDNGTILGPHELPPWVTRTISSVKVKAIEDKEGNIVRTYTYKFWDKIKAQDMLNKIHGSYEKDNEQKKNDLRDLIDEIAAGPRHVASQSRLESTPKAIDAGSGGMAPTAEDL